MSDLRIEPVIEVLGDDTFDLWPVVGRAGFWYLALHGQMTDAEVGTAIHQILRWFHTDENDKDAASDLTVYLGRALGPHDPNSAQPIAMGGVRFVDTSSGTSVLPGCCYSIDMRSEILDVADGTQRGAFLGHDPDTGITRRDGFVEILQGPDDSTSPILRYRPEEVRTALARTEADLDTFCDRVGSWADTHAPEYDDLLPEAVARALEAGTYRAAPAGPTDLAGA